MLYLSEKLFFHLRMFHTVFLCSIHHFDIGLLPLMKINSRAILLEVIH